MPGTSDKAFIPISPEMDIDGELEDYLIAKAGIRLPARGLEDCKHAIDSLYFAASAKLDDLLKSRDTAGWIRVAYEQLELWSWIIHSNNDDIESDNHMDEYAAIARYGWRYIIDISLANLDPEQSVILGRPNLSDIREAFTLFNLMYVSTEQSNQLHYFPILFDYFEVVKQEADCAVKLSVVYSEKARKRFSDISGYISRKARIDNYSELHSYSEPSSVIRQSINTLLTSKMEFNIDDIHLCMSFILEGICRQGGAASLVILHSEPYIQKWISDYTGLDIKKTRKILDFVLLTQGRALSCGGRDFRRKSQTMRMAYYAGIRLPKIRRLESLYFDTYIGQIINAAQYHIIISPFQVAEWIDGFCRRIVHGLRPDLKTNSALRKRLEAIEQTYKKTIFEGVVRNVLRSHGLVVIDNVARFSEGAKMSDIPCGEIDALAYMQEIDMLMVVECKCSAPAIDVKMTASDVKDLHEQKIYHKKLISKLNWVRSHMDFASCEFQRKRGVSLKDDTKIVALMVTMHPSAMKFFESAFDIIMLDELDDYLAELKKGLT